MKVPKNIQDKMRKSAKLYKQARKLLNEVDEYLSENYNGDTESGMDGLEPWRSGNGVSLEEIEYGNDVTDEFVEWADNDFKTQ